MSYNSSDYNGVMNNNGTTTTAITTSTNTAKRYVINDKIKCEGARFKCADGESAFFDEKGCGCVGADNTDSFPPIDVSDKFCTPDAKPVCGELQIQCIKAPCLPIKQTFPNRCEAEKLNVLNITEGACTDENALTVSAPVQDSLIKSPVKITGQAVGSWFFEGTFPSQVTDASGTVLGTGSLKANGEWMTPKNVPFSGILIFKKSTTPTGFIVLHNDNPSGLKENAREFKLPVRFFESPVAQSCVVGGCSGEVCSEGKEPMMSPCLYKPEFGCYKTATCAAQASGGCGWMQTPELKACLAKNQ